MGNAVTFPALPTLEQASEFDDDRFIQSSGSQAGRQTVNLLLALRRILTKPRLLCQPEAVEDFLIVSNSISGNDSVTQTEHTLERLLHRLRASIEVPSPEFTDTLQRLSVLRLVSIAVFRQLEKGWVKSVINSRLNGTPSVFLPNVRHQSNEPLSFQAEAGVRLFDLLAPSLLHSSLERAEQGVLLQEIVPLLRSLRPGSLDTYRQSSSLDILQKFFRICASVPSSRSGLSSRILQPLDLDDGEAAIGLGIRERTLAIEGLVRLGMARNSSSDLLFASIFLLGFDVSDEDSVQRLWKLFLSKRERYFSDKLSREPESNAGKEGFNAHPVDIALRDHERSQSRGKPAKRRNAQDTSTGVPLESPQSDVSHIVADQRAGWGKKRLIRQSSSEVLLSRGGAQVLARTTESPNYSSYEEEGGDETQDALSATVTLPSRLASAAPFSPLQPPSTDSPQHSEAVRASRFNDSVYKSFQSLDDLETRMASAYETGNKLFAASVPEFQTLALPLLLRDSVHDWISAMGIARGLYRSVSATAADTPDLEVEVWTCGQNSYGELGHGDTINRTRLTRVEDLLGQPVVSVMSGNEHTFVLLRHGEALACGYNDHGQCGVGHSARVPVFSRVLSPEQLDAVYAANGCEHALLVSRKKELWVCGFNSRGQLGLGHTISRSVPILLRPLRSRRVKTVACSYYHSLVATDDGFLWGFGRNDYGQLGTGNTIDVSEPVSISTLNKPTNRVKSNRSLPFLISTSEGFSSAAGSSAVDIVSVACGQYHSVVVLGDGSVWSFGKNDYGQLGLEGSFTTMKTLPCLVKGLLFSKKSIQVACGYYHTLVLDSLGQVYSFGRNDHGQLGLGHSVQKVYGPQLVRDIALEDYELLETYNVDSFPKEALGIVAEIATGCYHSLLRSFDGKLLSFGRNSHGQLGLGDTTERHFPTLVPGTEGLEVISISAGFYHTSILARKRPERKHIQVSEEGLLEGGIQALSSPITMPPPRGAFSTDEDASGESSSWSGSEEDEEGPRVPQRQHSFTRAQVALLRFCRGVGFWEHFEGDGDLTVNSSTSTVPTVPSLLAEPFRWNGPSSTTKAQTGGAGGSNQEPILAGVHPAERANKRSQLEKPRSQPKTEPIPLSSSSGVSSSQAIATELKVVLEAVQSEIELQHRRNALSKYRRSVYEQPSDALDSTVLGSGLLLTVAFLDNSRKIVGDLGLGSDAMGATSLTDPSSSLFTRIAQVLSRTLTHPISQAPGKRQRSSVLTSHSSSASTLSNFRSGESEDQNDPYVVQPAAADGHTWVEEFHITWAVFAGLWKQVESGMERATSQTERDSSIVSLVAVSQKLQKQISELKEALPEGGLAHPDMSQVLDSLQAICVKKWGDKPPTSLTGLVTWLLRFDSMCAATYIATIRRSHKKNSHQCHSFHSWAVLTGVFHSACSLLTIVGLKQDSDEPGRDLLVSELEELCMLACSCLPSTYIGELLSKLCSRSLSPKLLPILGGLLTKLGARLFQQFGSSLHTAMREGHVHRTSIWVMLNNYFDSAFQLLNSSAVQVEHLAVIKQSFLDVSSQLLAIACSCLVDGRLVPSFLGNTDGSADSDLNWLRNRKAMEEELLLLIGNILGKAEGFVNSINGPLEDDDVFTPNVLVWAKWVEELASSLVLLCHNTTFASGIEQRLIALMVAVEKAAFHIPSVLRKEEDRLEISCVPLSKTAALLMPSAAASPRATEESELAAAFIAAKGYLVNAVGQCVSSMVYGGSPGIPLDSTVSLPASSSILPEESQSQTLQVLRFVQVISERPPKFVEEGEHKSSDETREMFHEKIASCCGQLSATNQWLATAVFARGFAPSRIGSTLNEFRKRFPKAATSVALSNSDNLITKASGRMGESLSNRTPAASLKTYSFSAASTVPVSPIRSVAVSSLRAALSSPLASSVVNDMSSEGPLFTARERFEPATRTSNTSDNNLKWFSFIIDPNIRFSRFLVQWLRGEGRAGKLARRLQSHLSTRDFSYKLALMKGQKPFTPEQIVLIPGGKPESCTVPSSGGYGSGPNGDYVSDADACSAAERAVAAVLLYVHGYDVEAAAIAEAQGASVASTSLPSTLRSVWRCAAEIRLWLGQVRNYSPTVSKEKPSVSGVSTLDSLLTAVSSIIAPPRSLHELCDRVIERSLFLLEFEPVTPSATPSLLVRSAGLTGKLMSKGSKRSGRHLWAKVRLLFTCMVRWRRLTLWGIQLHQQLGRAGTVRGFPSAGSLSRIVLAFLMGVDTESSSPVFSQHDVALPSPPSPAIARAVAIMNMTIADVRARGLRRAKALLAQATLPSSKSELLRWLLPAIQAAGTRTMNDHLVLQHLVREPAAIFRWSSTLTHLVPKEDRLAYLTDPSEGPKEIHCLLDAASRFVPHKPPRPQPAASEEAASAGPDGASDSWRTLASGWGYALVQGTGGFHGHIAAGLHGVGPGMVQNLRNSYIRVILIAVGWIKKVSMALDDAEVRRQLAKLLAGLVYESDDSSSLGNPDEVLDSESVFLALAGICGPLSLSDASFLVATGVLDVLQGLIAKLDRVLHTAVWYDERLSKQGDLFEKQVVSQEDVLEFLSALEQEEVPPAVNEIAGRPPRYAISRKLKTSILPKKLGDSVQITTGILTFLSSSKREAMFQLFCKLRDLAFLTVQIVSLRTGLGCAKSEENQADSFRAQQVVAQKMEEASASDGEQPLGGAPSSELLTLTPVSKTMHLADTGFSARILVSPMALRSPIGRLLMPARIKGWGSLSTIPESVQARQKISMRSLISVLYTEMERCINSLESIEVELARLQGICATPLPTPLTTSVSSEFENEAFGLNRGTSHLGLKFSYDLLPSPVEFTTMEAGICVPPEALFGSHATSDAPEGVLDQKDFSLSFWVWLDPVPMSRARVILLRGNGYSQQCPMVVLRPSDMRLEVGVTTKLHTLMTLTSKSPIPLQTWTHVAMTCEPNRWRLFVNGVQEAQRSSRGCIGGNLPIYLGCLPSREVWLEGLKGGLEGKLCGVKLHTRALSPIHVRILFDQGPPSIDPEGHFIHESSASPSAYARASLPTNTPWWRAPLSATPLPGITWGLSQQMQSAEKECMRLIAALQPIAHTHSGLKMLSRKPWLVLLCRLFRGATRRMVLPVVALWTSVFPWCSPADLDSAILSTELLESAQSFREAGAQAVHYMVGAIGSLLFCGMDGVSAELLHSLAKAVEKTAPESGARSSNGTILQQLGCLGSQFSFSGPTPRQFHLPYAFRPTSDTARRSLLSTATRTQLVKVMHHFALYGDSEDPSRSLDLGWRLALKEVFQAHLENTPSRLPVAGDARAQASAATEPPAILTTDAALSFLLSAHQRSSQQYRVTPVNASLLLCAGVKEEQEKSESKSERPIAKQLSFDGSAEEAEIHSAPQTTRLHLLLSLGTLFCLSHQSEELGTGMEVTIPISAAVQEGSVSIAKRLRSTALEANPPLISTHGSIKRARGSGSHAEILFSEAAEGRAVSSVPSMPSRVPNTEKPLEDDTWQNTPFGTVSSGGRSGSTNPRPWRVQGCIASIDPVLQVATVVLHDMPPVLQSGDQQHSVSPFTVNSFASLVGAHTNATQYVVSPYGSLRVPSREEMEAPVVGPEFHDLRSSDGQAALRPHGDISYEVITSQSTRGTQLWAPQSLHPNSSTQKTLGGVPSQSVAGAFSPNWRSPGSRSRDFPSTSNSVDAGILSGASVANGVRWRGPFMVSVPIREIEMTATSETHSILLDTLVDDQMASALLSTIAILLDNRPDLTEDQVSPASDTQPLPSDALLEVLEKRTTDSVASIVPPLMESSAFLDQVLLGQIRTRALSLVDAMLLRDDLHGVVQPYIPLLVTAAKARFSLGGNWSLPDLERRVFSARQRLFRLCSDTRACASSMAERLDEVRAFYRALGESSALARSVQAAKANVSSIPLQDRREMVEILTSSSNTDQAAPATGAAALGSQASATSEGTSSPPHSASLPQQGSSEELPGQQQQQQQQLAHRLQHQERELREQQHADLDSDSSRLREFNTLIGQLLQSGELQLTDMQTDTSNTTAAARLRRSLDAALRLSMRLEQRLEQQLNSTTVYSIWDPPDATNETGEEEKKEAVPIQLHGAGQRFLLIPISASSGDDSNQHNDNPRPSFGGEEEDTAGEDMDESDAQDDEDHEWSFTSGYALHAPRAGGFPLPTIASARSASDLVTSRELNGVDEQEEEDENPTEEMEDEEEEEENSGNEPPSDLVNELMLMGFPEQWCVMALQYNANDLVAASSWIVDNMDQLCLLSRAPQSPELPSDAAGQGDTEQSEDAAAQQDAAPKDSNSPAVEFEVLIDEGDKEEQEEVALASASVSAAEQRAGRWHLQVDLDPFSWDSKGVIGRPVPSQSAPAASTSFLAGVRMNASGKIVTYIDGVETTVPFLSDGGTNEDNASDEPHSPSRVTINGESLAVVPLQAIAQDEEGKRGDEQGSKPSYRRGEAAFMECHFPPGLETVREEEMLQSMENAERQSEAARLLSSKDLSRGHLPVGLPAVGILDSSVQIYHGRWRDSSHRNPHVPPNPFDEEEANSALGALLQQHTSDLRFSEVTTSLLAMESMSSVLLARRVVYQLLPQLFSDAKYLQEVPHVLSRIILRGHQLGRDAPPAARQLMCPVHLNAEAAVMSIPSSILLTPDDKEALLSLAIALHHTDEPCTEGYPTRLRGLLQAPRALSTSLAETLLQWSLSQLTLAGEPRWEDEKWNFRSMLSSDVELSNGPNVELAYTFLGMLCRTHSMVLVQSATRIMKELAPLLNKPNPALQRIAADILTWCLNHFVDKVEEEGRPSTMLSEARTLLSFLTLRDLEVSIRSRMEQERQMNRTYFSAYLLAKAELVLAGWRLTACVTSSASLTASPSAPWDITSVKLSEVSADGFFLEALAAATSNEGPIDSSTLVEVQIQRGSMHVGVSHKADQSLEPGSTIEAISVPDTAIVGPGCNDGHFQAEVVQLTGATVDASSGIVHWDARRNHLVTTPRIKPGQGWTRVYLGPLRSVHLLGLPSSTAFAVRCRAWRVRPSAAAPLPTASGEATRFKATVGKWSSMAVVCTSAPKPLQWDRSTSGPSVGISTNGLSAVFAGSESWSLVLASEGFTQGRNKWAVRIERSSTAYLFIGVAHSSVNTTNFLGFDCFGWGYIGDGALYHKRTKLRNYGEAFEEGDVIGVDLDMSKGTLSFSKNGNDLGVAFTGLTGEVYPAVGFYTLGQRVSLLPEACYCPTRGVSLPGTPAKLTLPEVAFAEATLRSVIKGQQLPKAFSETAWYQFDAWRRNSCRRYLTKSAYELLFDTTPRGCAKFGVRAGDKILTHLGPATVVGVLRGQLWVHGEGDIGAWYLPPVKMNQRKKKVDAGVGPGSKTAPAAATAATAVATVSSQQLPSPLDWPQTVDEMLADEAARHDAMGFVMLARRDAHLPGGDSSVQRLKELHFNFSFKAWEDGWKASASSARNSDSKDEEALEHKEPEAAAEYGGMADESELSDEQSFLNAHRMLRIPRACFERLSNNCDADGNCLWTPAMDAALIAAVSEEADNSGLNPWNLSADRMVEKVCGRLRRLIDLPRFQRTSAEAEALASLFDVFTLCKDREAAVKDALLVCRMAVLYCFNDSLIRVFPFLDLSPSVSHLLLHPNAVALDGSNSLGTTHFPAQPPRFHAPLLLQRNPVLFHSIQPATCRLTHDLAPGQPSAVGGYDSSSLLTLGLESLKSVGAVNSAVLSSIASPFAAHTTTLAEYVASWPGSRTAVPPRQATGAIWRDGILAMASAARGSMLTHAKRQILTVVLERTMTKPKRAEDDFDYPSMLPTVQVSRPRGAKSRSHDNQFTRLAGSLLGQTFQQLNFLDPQILRIGYTHPMDDGQQRAFKVKLEGEAGDDYGGVYRELFTQICQELQATDDDPSAFVINAAAGADAEQEGEAALQCLLPLLMPTPNRRSGLGNARERFMLHPNAYIPEVGPSPSALGEEYAVEGLLADPVLDKATGRVRSQDPHNRHGNMSPYLREMYCFVGKLLGVALRSGIQLRLQLVSLVWKVIVGEPLGVADLEEVDAGCLSVLGHLLDAAAQQAHAVMAEAKHQSEEQALLTIARGLHEPVFGFEELRWTTALADGTTVSLCSEGERRPVVLKDVIAYTRAVVYTRLTESLFPALLIAKGFASVVPAAMLPMLTGRELELLICGRDEVDIQLLQRNCEYDEGLSTETPHIQRFWRVLEGMSVEHKQQFLRFVWARSRLPPNPEFPQKFKIQLLLPEGLAQADAGHESHRSLRPPSQGDGAGPLSSRDRMRRRSSNATPIAVTGAGGEDSRASSTATAAAAAAAGGGGGGRRLSQEAIPAPEAKPKRRTEVTAEQQPLVDRMLPKAHTCFFSLALPPYSSDEVSFFAVSVVATEPALNGALCCVVSGAERSFAVCHFELPRYGR